ncbi:MAG: Lrp/AsnC family transcriptional regulator [Methylococcaceae bacterium]|nr:Lrp/AsnC family transcriptional regulator [Methylococcaceae bacterium]
MEIDEIDRQIIAATQTGLPLTLKPYQTIADSIGISDEVVMQKIVVMQEQGIIRRIAAVPNHYRLGYKYNGMTVWNIEDKHINEMGECIGQLNFVSHCYHRPRHLPEWPYNLFAMIHSKTEEGVKRQQQIIADLLGQYNLGQDVLYSTRILKKTGLRIR